MFEILRFITRDLSRDTLKNPVRNIFYDKNYNQIKIFYKKKGLIFESLVDDIDKLREKSQVYVRGQYDPYRSLTLNNIIYSDITSYDDTELLYLIRNASDENIKIITNLQDHEYEYILNTIQKYKDNIIPDILL